MAARNPYPALTAILVVPLVALVGVWRWADTNATTTDVPISTVAVAPPEPPAALTTPLLSVRRAPQTLAATLDTGEFARRLEPVAALIGPTACISVSVDGEEVLARNDRVALRPASNVKLFTGAVAIDVLGAEFRYTTNVTGTVRDGVVDGDLYLVGGGDPVLSEPWWQTSTITLLPPTVITDLTVLADRVRDAGVTTVTGRVVGDGSRYDDERFAPTLTQDVKAQLEALPVSALVVNDTRTSSTSVASNPEVGAAQVFARLLTERGISVGGGAGAGVAAEGAATIASIESAPFAEVVAEMLTTSDNLSAEMILKEIGIAVSGVGSREAGLAAVTARMAEWGIPLEGTELVDGSGLSDQNRTTCAALAAVLRRGRATDVLGEGLPVAGARNGTLASAFVETSLEGRLRAKTGTLNNNDGVPDKPGAKSLSGYVPTDTGSQIEFSLLLNGETITNRTEYRPIWDAFGAVASGFPYGPTLGALRVR